MTKRKRLTSLLRMLMCVMFLGVSFAGFSQVDSYEIGSLGYLRNPMETDNGIVLSNNRYTEIYLLKNNALTTLVKGRGCGIYTQMSKDKKLVGFKSINDDLMQAPAVVDVATGNVTLLEDYCNQCGQVSFSNDGTIAYTMGNTLVVRKGDERKTYDLGLYSNIVNLSPDATHVSYSNIDGRMFVMDLTTGKSVQIDVNGGYNGVWSPDGSKLAIETAEGSFAVLEMTGNKVYNLGKGVSVSWANNSDELIYTLVEGNDEMQVLGSSIKRVKFDGSARTTIIATSEDMPTDAVMTADNKLLVSYSTGVNRGLVLREMPSTAIKPFSAAEEILLYGIEEGEHFGASLANPDKTSVRVKPAGKIRPKSYQQTIDALDIPYINQVYDVPSVDGCTSWGKVACAPTSACMALGYHGLLDPVTTTSRYDSSVKRQYAYHIGSVYTNQKGTAKFDETKYKYCANIPGGYGYMWKNSSPQTHMVDFLLLNGCAQAVKTYSSTVAWNTFQSESEAGRPYIMCVKLTSGSGHVILGFATNCVYTSASGFLEKQGSFVCHDPYGDRNYSDWPNFEGQHSSYDWVGVNNGQANIGEWYWSVTAVPPTDDTATDAVELFKPMSGTANSFAYDLNSEVTGTTLTANYTLNVKAETVTVNVKNSAGEVVLTTSGAIAKGAHSVSFDIANLADGKYTWDVEVDCADKTNVQEFAALRYYHPRGVDVDNNMESDNFGDIYVTEGMSTTNTTYYPANNGGVGLYIFNPDMTGVKNETTGKYAFMGGLTYSLISYGADLARVRVAEDGRIFVTRCNSAGDYILYAPSQADLVKNNKFTSLLSGGTLDSSTYLYNIDSEFLAAPNVGFDVKGSGEDLKLLTIAADKSVFSGSAAGSRVDEYALGNATVLPTPTKIQSLSGYTASSKCTNVEYDSRGGKWYCQYVETPTATTPALVYVDANGTQKYFEGLNGNVRGGGGIRLSPDEKQIAIASSTARFTIYDLSFGSDGVPQLKEKMNIIHGIGTNVYDIAWDLAGNLYIVGNSGEYLKGFALPRSESFTTRAASKYAFRIGASAIECVEVEAEDAPVEYYNLQGVKVANPSNGIFIRKQGSHTTKVVL